MKITKDCYVNVSGWTDEEVLEAAKMFAEAGGGIVDNIQVEYPDEDYKYLMILGGDAFVGATDDLYYHGCVKEMTKQDIFEDQQQSSEYSGESLPPVGEKCLAVCSDGEYHEVEIVYVNRDQFVAVFEDPTSPGLKYYWQTVDRFKPIKSEKQKEIEEILSNIRQDYSEESLETTHPREYVENAIQQLYDKGYIKGSRVEDDLKNPPKRK